jgi:hypothetical protein
MPPNLLKSISDTQSIEGKPQELPNCNINPTRRTMAETTQEDLQNRKNIEITPLHQPQTANAAIRIAVSHLAAK